MQYILSQEEFDNLKFGAKQQSIQDKTELQRVCTKVANEMPVGWSDKKDKPWGCIITKGQGWYCDNCPVQTICPKEWKNYSQ